MTNNPDGHGAAPSTEELRAQVEETRRELGETVEALAARADLKAQTRAKAQQAAIRTRDNPSVPVAAGMAALLALALFIRRKRQQSHSRLTRWRHR
ncbi:DUF3618 domain-containing protein [Streptomyces sp. CA-250714]|uniref:DUF3618 domain-containing protein n=1 Tax=Streptomyces sp. CA-250714 TaxID=3240060 RepID=UPI003D8DE165